MAKRPLVFDPTPAPIGDNPPEATPTPPPTPPPPILIPKTSAAPEVLTIQLPGMMGTNTAFLSIAMRRLRELILEGQSRRAEGRIVIEVHMIDGNLTGAIGISPKWLERLNR